MTVLEADPVVGGISRTTVADGWRFDIGGHRFFTKVPAVSELWHEILDDGDFLVRPRMSRIFYRGRFYDYPLKATNALRNLGPLEAARCALSYAWVRIHPPRDQTTFEGWTAGRFGWRLYRTFFKTYTEKVWGVPADQIQADWAAQRIKNLSLFSAVLNSLLPRRNQKEITSLIEEFEYPRYGPGMMWERCHELVTGQGGDVLLEHPVQRIRHADGVAYAVVADAPHGPVEFPATSIISSMPGFVSLRLSRGIERPDVYVLLVEWMTLEDHTEGFRQSNEYLQWKKLLHHFYDPFPIVEHFSPVLGGS